LNAFEDFYNLFLFSCLNGITKPNKAGGEDITIEQGVRQQTTHLPVLHFSLCLCSFSQNGKQERHNNFTHFCLSGK